MVVGQATNNGGLFGEENHTWLLVRQTTMAFEIIHVVGQANNNGNPKPVPPEADKLSGGRHINRTLGEGNRSWLLVRQTTMENQSPPPAGGILIDHWAREIIHGCWSGDQQRQSKARLRRAAY
jgi:hypothetical protein